MGSIVEATGLTQLYIVVSSVCGFASAYLASRVVFDQADAERWLTPQPKTSTVTR